jgi:hypothetical protein
MSVSWLRLLLVCGFLCGLVALAALVLVWLVVRTGEPPEEW